MKFQRAPFRLLRTAVVASAVVPLAAGSHVLGCGQLPPAPLMTALTALCVVLATKRQMSVLSLTAVLAAGQALLHEAFSTLSGSTPPTSNAQALHIHETVVVAPVGSAGPELHRQLPADLDPPMLTLHVVATVATAVLLARGEAALWALAAWLRPLTGIPWSGSRSWPANLCLFPGLSRCADGGFFWVLRCAGLLSPPAPNGVPDSPGPMSPKEEQN